MVGPVTLPVFDKFTGRRLADVVCAGRDDITRAVSSAARAFEAHRLSPYERHTVLHRVASLLQQQKPRFVETIVAESGFTVSDAETEIARATQTLILDQFLDELAARTAASRVGDPRDSATLVGPMIDVGEAERADTWVNEAVAQGATIVTGGRRDGAVFHPTILINATPRMRVMCEEIFAPVISIVPFRALMEAIEQVNSTPYGLAAGVFTSNVTTALTAARHLDVGSVHINETSSSRVDLMPYGGVKDSGFGREGPMYATREMTEAAS